ncbi:Uncharacterized protein dnm_067020 [Desulfonema magnum]|uniref:Uncharacterized protein n=1 Tax=Desulfonema magnum TaxID=45655 RepID=A0A975GR32_9BACT|nr:Uncharacterized protein dnm_067020 [Desulfonema magnum]
MKSGSPYVIHINNPRKNQQRLFLSPGQISDNIPKTQADTYKHLYNQLFVILFSL